MSSRTRKPAQLSTLLCFPRLSARPGLPGIPWAAPATDPTVPEHGAERGWNGNRQLMGTQRMVKTFSSGDSAVWRFLSGTWPSQRPVVLCLFFSAMSASIFQFIYPHSVFLHFILTALHLSCLMFCLFQLRYCLSFIYVQLNAGQRYIAYLGGELHTCHSYQQQPECNYYYYCFSVFLYLPAPLLTPLFFLHPFHAAGFTGQAKLADTKTSLLTTVCEALSSEWSLQLHAQQQCLVMGTGWAPSLTSSPDI